MSDIKAYGTTWCGDCTRAKQFMDENGVSYNCTDVDEETQYQDYIKGLNNGQMRVPTIIFPDGSILVEPSNKELAEKIPV